jgi:RNA 3'-terminal phosphate cyclase (ATP)
MAGGKSFVTLKPSSHTLTNMEVISAFMDINIQAEEISDDVWHITLS